MEIFNMVYDNLNYLLLGVLSVLFICSLVLYKNILRDKIYELGNDLLFLGVMVILVCVPSSTFTTGLLFCVAGISLIVSIVISFKGDDDEN